MKKISLFLFAALFTLAACGGGSESAEDTIKKYLDNNDYEYEVETTTKSDIEEFKSTFGADMEITNLVGFSVGETTAIVVIESNMSGDVKDEFVSQFSVLGGLCEDGDTLVAVISFDGSAEDMLNGICDEIGGKVIK